MKLLAQLALLWIRPAAAFLPRTYARSSLLRMSAGTMAGAPAEKHTVLVVGCGGKLGSLIFGWLQEASNNGPRTGMKHPRGLTGHPKSARLLNSVLSGPFMLGQAGEQYVYAETAWQDPDELAVRMFPGNYGVVFGSAMATERWQISGTPFEDLRFEGSDTTSTAVNGAAPASLRERADQLARIADGAAAAGVRHAVCVLGGALGGGGDDDASQERRELDGAAVEALVGAGVPFTLVVPVAPQPALKDAPGWYFRKGVERRRLALSARDVTGEDAVKVADAVKDAVKAAAAAADEEAGPLMMEDVSRLVSESLQHCPPEKSRVIAVSAAADGEAAISKVTENEAYFAKLLASA